MEAKKLMLIFMAAIVAASLTSCVKYHYNDDRAYYLEHSHKEVHHPLHPKRHGL